MNKYVTEFIGTFFLVLTIGCTVLAGQAGVIPPLAIGAMLMVMVFAGGHISGAHYNPAVTVAVWLRGKCLTKDVIPYWIAQILAAVAAAYVARHLTGVYPVPSSDHFHVHRALHAEFLFTFALCYVVLNVATAKGTGGNSFYGLAIGFTVLAGAFSVGHISGGAFNPAVAVGVSVMGLSAWDHLWVFLVANFSAAVVASMTFRMLNRADLSAEALPAHSGPPGGRAKAD
jgi:aquaporin Z